MKSLIKALTLTVLLTFAPVVGFAATTNNILLVFNGNTEVNRHTYNFIRQEFQMSGLNYGIYAEIDPNAVLTKYKTGQFKAVVVISDNVTSGVDPAITRFIKGWKAPNEIYLVSMLSRNRSTDVTPFKAASSPAGVDGVTSATTWGFGSQQMHSQWVQQLADYLATK
jgi:hypothetical protein